MENCERKKRSGEGNLAVHFLLLKMHDTLLEWKEKNTNKMPGNYYATNKLGVFLVTSHCRRMS